MVVVVIMMMVFGVRALEPRSHPILVTDWTLNPLMGVSFWSPGARGCTLELRPPVLLSAAIPMVDV